MLKEFLFDYLNLLWVKYGHDALFVVSGVLQLISVLLQEFYLILPPLLNILHLLTVAQLL